MRARLFFRQPSHSISSPHLRFYSEPSRPTSSFEFFYTKLSSHFMGPYVKGLAVFFTLGLMFDKACQLSAEAGKFKAEKKLLKVKAKLLESKSTILHIEALEKEQAYDKKIKQIWEQRKTQTAEAEKDAQQDTTKLKM